MCWPATRARSGASSTSAPAPAPSASWCSPRSPSPPACSSTSPSRCSNGSPRRSPTTTGAGRSCAATSRRACGRTRCLRATTTRSSRALPSTTCPRRASASCSPRHSRCWPRAVYSRTWTTSRSTGRCAACSTSRWPRTPPTRRAEHAGEAQDVDFDGDEDQPDTVAEQLAWLRDAGFEQTEVHFKWAEAAVFGGIRPKGDA